MYPLWPCRTIYDVIPPPPPPWLPTVPSLIKRIHFAAIVKTLNTCLEIMIVGQMLRVVQVEVIYAIMSELRREVHFVVAPVEMLNSMKACYVV